MSIAFTPAIRDRVGLIIGMIGASGSGKTMSALKLARGLAGGDDSKIAVIDTEAGRAKHYAPAPGEKPSEFRFGFQHGDLKPPFTPEAYTEAIQTADKAGFEVIVIDSFSHEWEGEGGQHDIHLEELEKAVERARKYAGANFDEDKAYERSSMGAWKEPKSRHRRLVARLLQCRAHLIICMRADEKVRMETVEEEGRNGQKYKKTVITQPKDLPIEERWVPICEKKFPYELTLSLLLAPVKPGVPIPLKLQEQHKPAVPLDRQVNEETGRQLAEWARGGALKQSEDDRPPRPLDELVAAGDAIAGQGVPSLEKWWSTSLNKKERVLLKEKIGAWKTTAAAVKPTEPKQGDLPV